MAERPKPAVIYLRMSPQLRDGLRQAANDAGCSLNAFAVNVLAAAAGDPARFRGSTSGGTGVHDLERDDQGYPLDWRARWEHRAARAEFLCVMERGRPSNEAVALVRRLDAENPWYFAEWRRLRTIEETAGSPDARRVT
jgi:hypothetical protein